MPPSVLPAVATTSASQATSGWSFSTPSSTSSDDSGISVEARKVAINSDARLASAEKKASTAHRIERKPRLVYSIWDPLRGGLLFFGKNAQRLSRTHPEGARLRRRGRDAPRARAEPVGTPGQPPAAEARGHAARVLVQVPRRVQQDGATQARRARARRH